MKISRNITLRKKKIHYIKIHISTFSFNLFYENLSDIYFLFVFYLSTIFTTNILSITMIDIYVGLAHILFISAFLYL